MIKDKKIINNNELYSFFCETCQLNLCKISLNEHNGHTIIEFDKDKLEIKRKIDYIIDIFNLNEEIGESSINEDQLEFNNREKLVCLISSIIKNYNNYPNYNIIRNINRIYDSLSYYVKTHPKDKNLKNSLNVETSTDFYELIKKKDNISIIKSIIIYGMNFYNLEVFGEIRLSNLTKLDLRRNNISDISWLANEELPNLEILNLGMNELDDDMIKYIAKFRFPKLTYLNFYNNYFSDYNFFEAVDIKHFSKLTFLSVSSNRFNYDISKIDINNIEFDLSKLEKICFNNGVFSDDSSKLLTRFIFSSAKTIFLAANNFTNIDFIEKMELPKLSRLCLDNNKISSVNKLNCLKKKSPDLKTIELKSNCLENIREIEDLLSDWNLDEFNITGNKIDLKIS